MIILDKPYVSNFLLDFLEKTQTPVINFDSSIRYYENLNLNLMNEESFKKEYQNSIQPLIYSNSENSLDWIKENIPNLELKTLITHFKDKFIFRNLLKQYYPDYKFKKVLLKNLNTININDIPTPFVIKPNIGFFSIAVYVVQSVDEWQDIVQKIKIDIEKNLNIFPQGVIDTSEFIIEEVIEGEEYAVDAYYNESGEPVILNIYHHYYLDKSDTGDRLYYTSKKVIHEKYQQIFDILVKIQKVTNAKQFPMHLELRLDDNNNFGIIEANPMRFAGFCVGDLTWFAFKINPYEFYLNQTKPNWDIILDKLDNSKYAFVLGDIPDSISIKNIEYVNYDEYRNKFSEILELRKLDFTKYPIFAITFVKFSESNEKEMINIMKDDFCDVLITNKAC